MKDVPPASFASGPDADRQRLSELRHALLHLHKALVDSERVGYEKNIGVIRSPNHFLDLLTRDPWFVWLHPLSQLIVSMDESLDGKEPVTPAGVNALANQARRLLVATENGEGFAGNYFEALQRDPEVIFAHAAVMRLFKSRKP